MEFVKVHESFPTPELRLDEVVAETLLMSVEEMAQQSGLGKVSGDLPGGLHGPTPRSAAVRERTGWKKGNPSLALGSRVRLELRPSITNWNDYDQLAVPVWIGEGAGGSLSVTIYMSTHTEGIQDQDYIFLTYPLGTRCREPWHGWRVLELPYENFLIYGIPDGWSSVERLVISVGVDKGEARLGDLILQKRKRAPGPRLTDRGLFDELDLTRPGLEQVAAALQRGEIDKAKRALVQHFRRRKEPRHIYPRFPAWERPFDTATADQICNHVILNQPLGEVIDWRANPIGYLEWMHAFNRHAWMTELVKAYLETGRRKYVAELDYLIGSWIDATPEPIGNNGGGDPAWETLSTAVRIYGAWLDVFFAVLQSEDFRDETLIKMLKAMWAHAQHLYHFSTTNSNNWLIVESQALATLGMLFPEFRRAPLWREEGFARLVQEIERQVYPDGVQHEVAPGYHIMSGNGFAEPYQIAQLNGYELPAIYRERLEGMFEYVMHITRPDGTLPSLNDSGGIHSRPTAWLAKGAELLGRADMEWVATRGAKGEPPAGGSKAFEDSGVYVMRTGWNPQDKYFLFDGGPFGAGHQHEDKLSFELYAFGTPFIVDPGITSYMREAWTEYYRDTFSHNTVLVNGRPQNRRHTESRKQYVQSVRGENLWACGRVADFVMSQYRSGYRGLDQDIRHRRAVLFVRPDYWCIFDEIVVMNPEEKPLELTAEALFHFTPMRLQIDAGKNRVRSNRLGLPNLELIPASPEQVEIAIVTGQHSPVQGWIAGGGQRTREDIPAPTVVLRVKGRRLVRFATLLIPFATGNSASVEVQLRVGDDGSLWQLTVTGQGVNDVIGFRWNDETDRASADSDFSLQFAGRAALVRAADAGSLKGAAVVDGHSLRWNGKELVSGKGGPAGVRQPLLEWVG